MANPKITILGDASGATAAFKEATAGAKDLEKQTDQMSAGFGRARIAGIRLRAVGGGLTALAGGLVVGAQAARATSDALRVTGAEAGTTEGKLRNLGASLLTGDIVGGLQALAAQSYLTKTALSALQQQVNEGDFSHFQKELESVNAGVHRSLRDLATGRVSIIDYVFGTGTENRAKLDQLLKLVDEARLSINRDIGAVPPGTPFSATPQIAGGTPGLGLRGSVFARGALAQQAIDEALAQARRAGLSQQLQTALAGSKATGGTANQLAQLRRADAALRRQLKQPGLTDSERESVFNSVSSIAGEIKSINDTIAANLKAKKDALEAARRAFQESLTSPSDALQLREALALGTSGRVDDIRVFLAELAELRGNLSKATSDGIRAQIAGAINSTKDALRQVVQDNKGLERLDKIQSARDVSRDLSDSQQALRHALQLGDPGLQKDARRDIQDAQLARKRLALQGVTFRQAQRGVGRESGGQVFGPVTINIQGAGDPVKVAEAVLAALRKKQKANSSQSRGRMPGHHLGLN